MWEQNISQGQLLLDVYNHMPLVHLQCFPHHNQSDTSTTQKKNKTDWPPIATKTAFLMTMISAMNTTRQYTKKHTAPSYAEKQQDYYRWRKKPHICCLAIHFQQQSCNIPSQAPLVQEDSDRWYLRATTCVRWAGYKQDADDPQLVGVAVDVSCVTTATCCTVSVSILLTAASTWDHIKETVRQRTVSYSMINILLCVGRNISCACIYEITQKKISGFFLCATECKLQT